MYITYESYITASGAYNDRLNNPELTEEIKENSIKLLDAINSLLLELGWVDHITVSSGFRPSDINGNTKGSAKHSYHTQCLAVDILDDKNQSLSNMIRLHPHLLKKHGLWMENPENTIGVHTNWTHLDLGNRMDRPSRIFNP